MAIIGASRMAGCASYEWYEGEAGVDDIKWELAGVCSGRLEAELLQSYLEARGIEVVLVQEALGHNVYPVTIDGLGRVQLFVSKKNSKEARSIVAEYQKPEARH